MLLTAQGWSAPPRDRPALAADRLAPVRAELVRALVEGRDVITVGLSAEPARLARLEKAALRLGATPHSRTAAGRLWVDAPVDRVAQLATLPGVVELVADQPLQLVAPDVAVAQAAVGSAVADPSAFALNLQAMAVPAGWRQNGGEGTVVAIVDTGVDPTHPALLGRNGVAKVVDWQDFTGEGDVLTVAAARQGDYLSTARGRFRIGQIVSVGGQYRFGVLREGGRSGMPDLDLDHSGSRRDEFGVLVVDSQQAGVYDTVYIDTNRNGDFTDETPLQIFRQTGAYTYFGRQRTGTSRTAVVLTDLSADGTRLTLGFDAHGHGTQVAGIAAGDAAAFQGVAPGARVMALKALHSGGTGSLRNVERAIEYAAQNGADIIGLSVEGVGAGDGWSTSGIAAFFDRMVRQYDVLIVMPSGNAGPGVGSARSPGNPAHLQMVGGYYTPAMWLRDRGSDLPRESLLYYSGVGPRADGAALPSLIAPAGGPAPVPLWLRAAGYQLAEGTSMAAAHVVGAAALLRAAARQGGLPSDAGSLKRAMELGARSLDHYSFIEQGHGVLQVEAAWRHLQHMNGQVAVTVQSAFGGAGIVARDSLPAAGRFSVSSAAALPLRLELRSTVSWLQAERQSLTLAPGRPREVTVAYDLADRPGLYSGLLIGDDPHTYGPDFYLVNTIIWPHRFPDSAPELRHTGRLAAGTFERYFFAVPEGAGELQVNFRVLRDRLGLVDGRGEIRLYRPDGQEVLRSGPLGVGSTAGATTVELIAGPMAGAWEAVLISLPDATAHGRDHTAFELELRLARIAVQDGPVEVFVPAGGGTAEVRVRLRNQWRGFSGYVIGGLLRQPLREKTEVVYGPGVIDTFQVLPDTAVLQLSVTSPSPRGSDLNLFLYRLDATVGDYVEYARAATPQVANEVLEVLNPPPGRYVAYVETPGLQRAGVRLQYSRRAAVAAWEQAEAARLSYYARGLNWEAVVPVTTPVEQGRHAGQIVVRDAGSGQTLAFVPLTIYVGTGRLTVQPLPAFLGEGKSGYVSLLVRDAATGRPVDLPVLVGGRQYEGRNGLVTVPVRGDAVQLSLTVRIEHPDYLAYAETFTWHLPWYRPQVPIRPDPADTLITWRRKLETLLQAPVP